MRNAGIIVLAALLNACAAEHDQTPALSPEIERIHNEAVERHRQMPPPDLSAPTLDELLAEQHENVHRPLRAFRAEPRGACQSANLTEARIWSGELGELNADAPLDLLQTKAALWLDVADAARERGCPKVAEEIYDGVIRTFIGSGFAAQRQRAELGIIRLQK